MARPKRDPLIAAMIAKLPEQGEWPIDRQLAWLQLMAMAFGTVYGGDAAAMLGQKASASTTTSSHPVAPQKKPDPEYYIDRDGSAMRRGGIPISAAEVGGAIIDLRGQDGDMKTIRWADGSTGLNGKDLTIIAG